MATIYGSRYGNSYGPRLEFEWSVVSQSMVNNSTYLKVITRINFNGTVDWSGAGKTGTTKANGISKSYTYGGGTRTSRIRTISTNYYTIYHNADGTASIPISGTFGVEINWSGTYISSISASGTAALPTINRSISNISFASGFATLEAPKTITFDKLNSSVVVQLHYQYWLPNKGVYSDWSVINTNYVSGTSFSIPQSVIDQIYNDRPDNTKATVKFRLTSYLSGSKIDENIRDIDFNLILEQPTASGTIACSGQNQSLLGSSWRGVQGIHKVTITGSGTAKKGASIDYYIYEYAGQKQTSSGAVTMELPSNVTDNKVYVTAVDTRGAKSERTGIATITSYPYKNPWLANFKSGRATSAGVESPVGDYLLITGNIAISTIPDLNGVQVNAPWWKISFDTTTRNTSAVKYTKYLAIQETATFTLEFGDKFSGTQKITGKIGVGQAPLVLGKNSIGVGTVPPEGGQGIYLQPELINGKHVFPMIEDFASKITIKSGLTVTNLKAIRYGRIAMISFTFKPTTDGFTTQILQLPPEYYPAGIRVSGSLDMTGSYDVRDANVQAYLTSDGAVGVVARPVPANAVNFTFNYITN